MHPINPVPPGSPVATSVVPMVEMQGPTGLGGVILVEEGAWVEGWEVVYTDPGRLPWLVYEVEGEGELVVEDASQLPLKHTAVDARIMGPVARVQVSQIYENPHAEAVEAVYVFPLPENSAVDGLRLSVGGKIIEGYVLEREEAREVYEYAKASGHVAALLEQERPNIFTQSVANIPPKEQVGIDIRYVQDLTYDNGNYEFVFPMVVGPRYAPGDVFDGAHITPPVLGKGERGGHDISLKVHVNAGISIINHHVNTHDVDSEIHTDGTLTVSLKPHDTIPNRDFVLRYAVAGNSPQSVVLSEWSKGAREGYFTLMIQPPKADVNALVGTREMIFGVDVSGSMRGVPIAMSKEILRDALGRLRPVDTFNIVTFSSGTQQLFSAPQVANHQNITDALQFVERMSAGGGTEMLTAVQQLFTAPIEPGIRRYLVLLTDGYIGDEEAVIGMVGAGIDWIRSQNADARAFTIGVGGSTNRFLIEGVAREGEGLAHYALNREDPALAVQKLFGVIDYPIWTDVEVDFGGLAVADLYPSQPQGLFASRPLAVHGRFTSPGSGTVTLRAKGHGGVPVEVPVTVTLSGEEGSGLIGTLWARARVEDVSLDMLYGAPYEAARQEIVGLGVMFGIVTQFTSFIAVDDSRRIGDGVPYRVVQPLERPEDVERDDEP